MSVVRSRFDSVQSILDQQNVDFSSLEITAFHGRKIIEAIAFGCLIATKNGFKAIPKDAEGQYNAEKILKTLSRKGIETFPSPSDIRQATPEEIDQFKFKIIIDGIPENRISKEELIRKYQRMHNWLHELNPYTKEGHEAFHQKHQAQLLKDLNDLKAFLWSHVMSINGEAFFCVLKDKFDGATKVISLTKLKG
jgi:hypothetical protein